VIERYRDEILNEVFSDGFRFMHYRLIELAYLEARKALGDPTATEQVIQHIQNFRLPTAEEVAEQEDAVGHDVVAFLYAWTQNMSPHAQSVIHRGLTSSDLVENVLFLQLLAVTEHIDQRLIELSRRLIRLHLGHTGTRRVSRTHGQLAEPSNAGWRFLVWRKTVEALQTQAVYVKAELAVFKSPGASGDMRLLGKEVGQRAAEEWLGNDVRMVASTQVIPRQRMIMWAGWMVAVASLVEEIALEVRLSSRSEVQEFQEGAARDRVGSSAMPHKRNPIGSERLSGMGRLVRSSFAAIAETAGALHHERDISNSSVERVAVPDMSHLVSFMVSDIALILDGLEINTGVMARNGHKLYDTALVQYRLQGMGLPYALAQVEAGLWASNGGWDYKRIIPMLNSYRHQRGLPTFDTASDFLGELDL
jgi:adenylosuccinate lyase